ncbi:hypothetical protein PUN28_003416 [Cardiocondyla obscurior]|uniref:Uncharacterized protein n=1 Tax=Cardiocondyla obscurior TaxID=286306 RepID=A0AAW2GM53_9HYME
MRRKLHFSNECFKRWRNHREMQAHHTLTLSRALKPRNNTAVANGKCIPLQIKAVDTTAMILLFFPQRYYVTSNQNIAISARMKWRNRPVEKFIHFYIQLEKKKKQKNFNCRTIVFLTACYENKCLIITRKI